MLGDVPTSAREFPIRQDFQLQRNPSPTKSLLHIVSQGSLPFRCFEGCKIIAAMKMVPILEMQGIITRALEAHFRDSAVKGNH